MGNTLLNKLYVCVTLTYRVRFLSPFALKMDVDFAHYGLKSGMAFKRNYESVLTNFKLQMNKAVQCQVLKNNSKCLNSTLTSLGQGNVFGSDYSLQHVQKPALKTAMKFRDQIRKRA